MFRQKWALFFTLCYEINDPLVQPWTVQGRSSNATPFVTHPRSTKEGDPAGEPWIKNFVRLKDFK